MGNMCPECQRLRLREKSARSCRGESKRAGRGWGLGAQGEAGVI